jgi:two-component system sensor histidine kinase BaeS
VRTGVDREDELGATARALDRLVAQLEQAERDRARVEAARSQFLAAVGHDLRSPLTVLQTGLEAIEDGVAEDESALVTRLQRETDLLGSLVEDLFLLARIESDGLSLRRERLDLAELADEAVEALGPVAARRDVRLATAAPHGVPVEGDARELGRVLRNLLDNAVRHAPTGSTVQVRVAGDGDGVRMEVLDEGPGFPAEHTDEVFGTFVRGDDARTRDGGGAGLGLAIARGLVDAHDGSIRAHPGPGGRVEVLLPAAP